MLVPCPTLTESPHVIDAIDSELRYVNTLSAQGRADDKDHGVAGQLITLRTLLDNAFSAWYSNMGDEPALEYVRKIAAAASRAMIMYGCVPRQPAPMRPVEPKIQILREDKDPSTL